ncbi:MAG TPA: hypothetical protein VFN57_05685 [Thermomicrobiaceae bacterium]|nr:hypothetical protein [Thermomicrobiaceae bacterium]
MSTSPDPALARPNATDVEWAGNFSHASVPLIVAGAGLVLVAACNLAVAWLPAHYQVTRLNLDGLGNWPAVAIGYGAATLVAFCCYAVAWRESRRLLPTRLNLVVVCTFPVVAALLLFPTYPLLSRDFFYTVMNARVMAVYHHNPFQTPPGAFPTDPFLPFSDWHQLTNPYGPLWAVIVGTVGRVTGSGILATFLIFKALFLVAFLGMTGLFAWFLRRTAPERLLPGLVLWSWNPLVLVETVADGHHDVIMLMLVLLAIMFATSDQPVLAVVAMVLAGDIKQTAFGIVPVLLVYLLRREPSFRHGVRRLAPGLLVAAGLQAVLYAPFWVGWRPTVIGFFHQTQSYIATPSALARLLLLIVFAHPGPAIHASAVLVGVVVYARLLWRLPGNLDGLLRGIYGAMLLAILIWPVFYPWYLLWLIVPAAALSAGSVSRQVIIVSVAAALSYLDLYGLRHIQAHSPQFWSAVEAVTVFGALLATAIWDRAEKSGGPVPVRESPNQPLPQTNSLAGQEE